MRQQIGAEVTAKVADEAEAANEAETQDRHQRTAMFGVEVGVEAKLENVVKNQFVTLPTIVVIGMVAAEAEEEAVDERDEEDVAVDGEKGEEVEVVTPNEMEQDRVRSMF